VNAQSIAAVAIKADTAEPRTDHDQPAPAGNNAEAFLASARRVAAQIAPEASRRDAERLLPYGPFDLIRQHRLAAGRLPRAYGGLEIAYADLAQAFIILAHADSNVAQALIPHHTTVERIRLMGSEAQRRHYFALLAGGAIVGGAASERGGQYRTDIHTRLRRAGDKFVLDGAKAYSTGSLMSDFLRISALDDDDKTVSVILPKTRPGITLLDDWTGMGQRATASGSTLLDQVEVDPGEVIPFITEGRGARSYATAATQLLHATIEVGIALAALDDAIHWARSGARPVKESGVSRASDDPYVQHAIGGISAHAHAAQAIVLSAATAVDRAAAATFSSAHSDGAVDTLTVQASIAVSEAKIISTEAALRAGELLYEVGGASTTLEANNFDRHWRNARTHTTHDPVAYKFKVVGNYLLNQVPPPVSLFY
jgi:alkylation response protein AidB-like acyl-CoA dehydrogenase